KSLQDGLDEMREAVDFCRYYAHRARQDFAVVDLPGPTGERNELYLQGRGVMACISPWNFPVAIFIGQVTAALLAGNTVVAKPAEQTCLLAVRCVELLLAAGLPPQVLALLPGDGEQVGSVIVADPRRSEEHTSELQSRENLVCRLLLEKKNKNKWHYSV